VRREVKDQITSLWLVSKADLDKAEARLASLLGAATGPVRKAATPPRRRGRASASAAPTPEGHAKKAPPRGRREEGAGQELGRREGHEKQA